MHGASWQLGLHPLSRTASANPSPALPPAIGVRRVDLRTFHPIGPVINAVPFVLAAAKVALVL